MNATEEAHIRAELDELRAANTRLQRKLKRRADAREELRDEVYRAARDAAVTVGPPRYIPPPKTRGKGRPEVALVHLTDWQDGKLTATYNMDICRSRVLQAVHKTISLTELHRHGCPVQECHVMLGGDMIENCAIFPGQAWEVEAGAFEQVFHAAALIRDALATLAGHYDRVVVHWVTGNHGRIARKGDHPKGDNFDRFVYEVARQADAPGNVEWRDTTNWYTHVIIGEYRALLVHGDQVGVAPVTIQNKVTRWASGTLDPFLDCYIGHRHHVKVLELPAGGRVFMTSSTESGSEYGREMVGADGPPTQRLNFVSPSRGRVTAEYLLELT